MGVDSRAHSTVLLCMRLYVCLSTASQSVSLCNPLFTVRKYRICRIIYTFRSTIYRNLLHKSFYQNNWIGNSSNFMSTTSLLIYCKGCESSWVPRRRSRRWRYIRRRLTSERLGVQFHKCILGDISYFEVIYKTLTVQSCRNVRYVNAIKRKRKVLLIFLAKELDCDAAAAPSGAGQIKRKSAT